MDSARKGHWVPVLLLLCAASSGRAAAQAPAGDAGAPGRSTAAVETPPDDEGEPPVELGVTARTTARHPEEPEASLSRSTVSRRSLEERLPRSAPDALRFEPGVHVQQSAHGQASPYVRGMTGQQVVHLFDGVRMNNGIYRQGPNQYFFAVDSRSVRTLQVIRGSASTRFGSDALGGAILAEPLWPFVDRDNEGLTLRPRLMARVAPADLEWGGRAELSGRLGPRSAFLVGGGYRDVGRLESGGVVEHLEDLSVGGSDRGSSAPWVPRFEEESAHPDDPSRWRTQLGTGYREVTFDGRVVHELRDDLRLLAALHGYRQFDAPRTDQCPPPEAPLSECLRIESQQRTLAYAALRGDLSPALRDVDLTLSFQAHHEARRRDRPRSFVRYGWADDVKTWGVSVRAASPPIQVGAESTLRLLYGAELYRDGVSSSAFQAFTDLGRVFPLSRGQYIDGSSYTNGGLFLEAEVTPLSWLTVRSGGRLSLLALEAAADPESGTQAISRSFATLVGRVGAQARVSEAIDLFLNVDQGFRAPNLDDLTSRQQTGPGFQFENPDLSPERSIAFELGLSVESPALRVEVWSFATLLDSAILRSVREADDCPPATPQCAASRTQFQLINAADTSVLLGAEGAVTWFPIDGLSLRGTVSHAFGEGPNTGSRPGDPAFDERRVPLSRVPPLNGTVEARYRHLETGIYGAAAMRFALSQTRLAPSDRSDARIPAGGTPGYAVFELRGGFRWSDRLRLSVVFENAFDAAYRVHGSSVNGPGRGLMAEAMVGF